ASLKIQDGCNSDCSYCRIHLARGKAISLPVQEVLNRVLLLESKGHAEVVLVGVNLSQYAGTFEHSPQTNEAHVYNFSKLLQFLLENTKSIAFRISSLYPQQITDEFCSVITNNRIRPHFHLSVQSGSDQILQKMNRNYSRDDITDAVKKLRKAKNNPFIACDIIVGFPSETESDFEKTLALCSQCNFSWIHAFSFSARPDTQAFLLENQISPAIKQQRMKKILALACIQKTMYCKEWSGKKLRAIIEKGRTNIIRAVTENFLHIEIIGKTSTMQELAGKEVCIKIEKINELTGKDGEIEAKAIFC
ncbi:MAG: radical SAM protein, partial [Treponemataceae bacterium]